MAKLSSRPVSEHAEVPLADDGAWEAQVDHWKARGAPAVAEGAEGHACYVVSVGAARDPVTREAQLAEIVSLVHHQGDRVVGQEIYHLVEPNPRTLLGKGTAERVAAQARAAGATLLVLDAELSPSQLRNLEDAAGIAVADREAVILNVFLRHARTRRARIQVEVAQLEYLRPRIRGVGIDMDQQTGGMARARGPGETASELLARKLDDRLDELRKTLGRLEASGRTQRRRRDSCRRIALVGYTNAGKTSLMNALAGVELSARDMPFETLDTTSRCLTRHGGDVLLSDTVGFIRRLPERLLASFESTLAEIAEASLLVVVVDASDPERALHAEATRAVIERLGAQEIPRLHVLNKIDRLAAPLAPEEVERLCGEDPFALVSCRDRQSVEALKETLLGAVRRQERELSVFVPYAATEALGLVHGKCRVLESVARERGMSVRVQGSAPVLARLEAALGRSRS